MFSPIYYTSIWLTYELVFLQHSLVLCFISMYRDATLGSDSYKCKVSMYLYFLLPPLIIFSFVQKEWNSCELLWKLSWKLYESYPRVATEQDRVQRVPCYQKLFVLTWRGFFARTFYLTGTQLTWRLFVDQVHSQDKREGNWIVNWTLWPLNYSVSWFL